MKLISSVVFLCAQDICLFFVLNIGNVLLIINGNKIDIIIDTVRNNIIARISVNGFLLVTNIIIIDDKRQNII
jgi:hypothetical protein